MFTPGMSTPSFRISTVNRISRSASSLCKSLYARIRSPMSFLPVRYNIGEYKLDTSNLYFVGLSNYEIEEITYIHENDIYARMSFEIEEVKVDKIVKEILGKIKTKYVHISFDLDVLKTSEFSAVNVGVENIYQDESGLTLNQAKKILKLLLTNLNVSSMDIVEYNPFLDKDEKCKNKIEEILYEIKGGINNDNSK